VANPFDQFDNTVQTGPVYGLPLHPPQQTPDQATGQSLQNVHTQLENQTIPLQQENTRTNIQQGQASIASTNNQIRNTNLDNVNNLRKQFETEQSTQDYKTVLPLMDSALKIQNNKAGDLNLVYAFGKAMDPGSVVREGEQVMATNVGGVSEKVKGYIDQINGQGQLTPVQRTQLIEELRNRSRSLQETYNQRRSFYEDFAKRNGINPNDVVGPHPGQPYQGDEAAYIQAHGGTPKIDGNPIAAPTQNEGHYGDERGATPLPPHSEEFRNGLYSAMRSGKIKSTADMTAWTDGFNAAHGSDFHPQISAKDTERAIQAAKSGRAFNVEQPKYNPDISDMRDGSGFGEKLDAGIRGAADTASFGLADKVAAAGDTLTQPNTTFDQNLARQYAISDYDTQSHFPSRLIGQIGGGIAMPMGEMSSVPQIALKSGAAGAAYGAGSSRSLGDMPLNALTGFGAGAALGAGLAGAGRGISALRGRGPQQVPPLVDPQPDSSISRLRR
jgi:hypothetical protein